MKKVKNIMKNTEYYEDSKEFDMDKDYLVEEITSQETFNPDVAYSKNPYWSKSFSNINKKQYNQKSADLIKDFEGFLSEVHNTANNKDNKMEFVSDYFTVFEYVFDSLSPEFKRATMQKLLDNLNNAVRNVTEESGVYKNVHAGRYGTYVSSELGITSIFENFQDKIIFSSKYKDIFEDIKKTSRPDNTKNIIQATLYNLPIDISRKWIDVLWSKEEQNLNYINLKPLAENNNQAFSYLVVNFKGWTNKGFLNVFFKFAYLGQSNIEQLEKNIGKIASQVTDEPAGILLKRKDLSDSGKIDILQRLFLDLSSNLEVFNFISDYLLNGSNQKDEFEKAPFYFSKSLQKQLSSIKTFESFYPQIDKLIKANLIDFNELDGVSNLLINLSTQELREIKAETLVSLTRLTEQKINSEQKENILLKIFDYATLLDQHPSQVKHFFSLFEVWKNDIDLNKFSKELTSKIETKSISTILMSNYNNFCSSLKDDFKDALFLKIFKNHSNDMLTFINDDMGNSRAWYESVFKHNKGWDVFENLFNINHIRNIEHINNGSNEAEKQCKGFTTIIKYLNLYRPDKTFNLEEINPVLFSISRISDYLEYGLKEKKVSLEHSNYGLRPAIGNLKESIGSIISELFENKIVLYVNKQNKTLKDELIRLGNSSKLGGDFFLSLVPETKEEKESFSFLNLFKNKEKIIIELPQNLSFKNKELILSNDSIIEINNDDGLKKSDFISKAQKEYSQIKNYLDSVKEKPLNMEIKIKSNNLMLDYLNFVTLIDSAKGIVGMEDMHFLENNLGSYLLESLRSYTKNVDRYDIMQKANDSGNFKKLFSGKTEEDIQKLKDRSDNECLRWIKLLEEQLELVKKNVIDQLNDDSLNDMKVRSKFLTARFPETKVEFPTDKIPAIKIR